MIAFTSRPKQWKKKGWTCVSVTGFRGCNTSCDTSPNRVSIYFDRHIEFNYDKGKQDGCDRPERWRMPGYLGSLTMNDPVLKKCLNHIIRLSAWSALASEGIPFRYRISHFFHPITPFIHPHFSWTEFVEEILRSYKNWSYFFGCSQF